MGRRNLLIRATALLAPPSLALALPGTSHAHGSQLGELSLRHPHAAPTLTGTTTGAVYLAAIHNGGDQADRLLSASTPLADRVELHQMRMDGDVMRMRAVAAIEVPARAAISMRQGDANGHHLMLFGLQRPLAVGDRFPLTLRFERAGAVRVEVRVEPPRPGPHHSH